MQWPHYHNLCWYHGFTPPPISARHFHHLLGTEFHHSRHSCPPSLPSLPPSSSSSFCTTIKFVPTALLLLSFLVRGPPICVCTLFLFLFFNLFFRVDVIRREDTKVALEGGMCCYTWSGDWQTLFVFMSPSALTESVRGEVLTDWRVNFNWRYEASLCQETHDMLHIL